MKTGIRYTAAQREQLLSEVQSKVKSGMGVEAAIKASGINRATYYAWRGKATRLQKKRTYNKKIKTFTVEAASTPISQSYPTVTNGYIAVMEVNTAAAFFAAMRSGV